MRRLGVDRIHDDLRAMTVGPGEPWEFTRVLGLGDRGFIQWTRLDEENGPVHMEASDRRDYSDPMAARLVDALALVGWNRPDEHFRNCWIRADGDNELATAAERIVVSLELAFGLAPDAIADVLDKAGVAARVASPRQAASAREVATEAHQGQVDKAGAAYITHPERVAAKMVRGTRQEDVAWLHDVVEDTAVTLDRLEALGFSQDVVDAVDAMTRRDGEQPDDYYARVAANSIAVEVKLADLADNTDPERLAALPRDVRDRLQEKYAHAHEALHRLVLHEVVGNAAPLAHWDWVFDVDEDRGGGFVTGQFLLRSDGRLKWRSGGGSTAMAGGGSTTYSFTPWRDFPGWANEADPEEAMRRLRRRGYSLAEPGPTPIGEHESGPHPGLPPLATFIG